ncbi:hypothetical protein KSZ96_17705 [Bacteroides thetaiotaomicron]|nr:hypothetical protein [Bacteroides thetaiotaomicron]MBV4330186.1 hypothetical protein [Bacteroides thetaiotaomicron]
MMCVNSNDVLEALVSNDRSELSKTFGVGMFVSETDTPEQVRAKCKSFVARFETYIANLNVIIDSGDKLVSEMKKAKVKRLFSSLDESEREAVKMLLD